MFYRTHCLHCLVPDSAVLVCIVSRLGHGLATTMKRSHDETSCFTADDARRDEAEHMRDLEQATKSWRCRVQLGDFHARKIPAADRDDACRLHTCIQASFDAYRQALALHPALLHDVKFCGRLARLYKAIGHCRHAGHAWLRQHAEMGNLCALIELRAMAQSDMLGTSAASHRLAWNVFVERQCTRVAYDGRVPWMFRVGHSVRNDKLCASVLRALLLRAVALTRLLRSRRSSPLYNRAMASETFVCQLLARVCVADHTTTTGVVIRPSVRSLRRAYELGTSAAFLHVCATHGMPREALEMTLLSGEALAADVDAVFATDGVKIQTGFIL